MSNASKMTLEERIVQQLKDDSLMKLVGDEDAITDLVHRALNEALYKPRRVYDRDLHREVETTTPAVNAAIEVINAAAEKLIDGAVEKLLEDEAFVDSVRKCFLASIPHIMIARFENAAIDQARETAQAEIMAQINSGFLKGPY